MSDETYPVTFVTETSHRELAEAVARAIHDHDEVLKFVLELDEVVADYDFTLQLRDALSAALAAEDAAELSPVPGLFWLRRWMKGDEEPPAGMDRFRDVDGNLVGRDATGNWLYLTVDGKVQDDSCSVPWSDLDDEYDMGWPLLPIAPSSEVSQ